MVIGIDFNGTVMSYDYPDSIGKDIGAVPVLQELRDKGHEFVLMTSVSRKDSEVANKRLDEMIDWFKDNGIEIIGINHNPRCTAVVDKARCDLFIDDHNLGVPLKFDESISYRPFVDWEVVRKMLVEMNIL